MNINYLTTPEALRSTIQDDPPIYEWFLNLIYQPKFRNDFCRNPITKELYQKFNSQKVLHNCMTFLAFSGLIISLFLKLYGFLGVAVAGIIIHYFVGKRLRKCVAEISLQKINDDFPANQLAQTTLYQLGEFYSQKYATYSIVDLLALSHEYLRTVLIGLGVVFLIVYPFFNISTALLIAALVFFSLKIIFNKSFIYNIQKKL